jgi:hypothetical protein
MRLGGFRLARSFLLGILLLAVAAPAAAATTWNVTNTGDGTGVCPSSTLCTLRAAVVAAADGDTVSVPAGVYSLTASDPIMIDNSITISGAGASTTTVDGGNATRIFEVGGGTSTPTVTISELTLEDGNGMGGDNPGDGGAVYVNTTGSTLTIEHAALNDNTAASAGAVFSDGMLIIENSTLSGNTASGFGGGGGAVFGNEGKVTIQGASISDNTSGDSGGAIFSNVPVTIQDTTLSGNSTALGGHANLGGGAIATGGTLSIISSTLDHNTSGAAGGSGNGGAIISGSTLTLTNSTLTANTANGSAPSFGEGGAITMDGGATLTNDTVAGNGAGAAGGSLYIQTGNTVTLVNTIVASGSAPAGSNCAGPGTFTSLGHNLEDTSPSQCGLGASGDLVGANPQLGPLQDNGGPAFTQALLAGSPAIDAGLNSSCPSTDERGVARPQGLACDIGAYEVAPPHGTTGSASGISSTGAALAGQAANPDAQAASVYFKYGTTTAYGSQTASRSLSPFSGSTGVSAGLSGLKPKTQYHFELVAVNPDGTSVGTDQTFTTTALSLGPIKIKPRRLKPIHGSGPSIVSKGKRGAIVSFTDSAAATTTFTVLKPTPGYRSGGRCVAHRPAKASKHVKRCTRWVSVGSFSHDDIAGTNRFRFSGRIGHHPLKRGRYRLQAIARLSGASSEPRTASFVVAG